MPARCQVGTRGMTPNYRWAGEPTHQDCGSEVGSLQARKHDLWRIQAPVEFAPLTCQWSEHRMEPSFRPTQLGPAQAAQHASIPSLGVFYTYVIMSVYLINLN